MQTVFQPDDRRTARASAFRHHPEYETARERHRREAREELRTYLDNWQAMSRRLESSRILESGWPC